MQLIVSSSDYRFSSISHDEINFMTGILVIV